MNSKITFCENCRNEVSFSVKERSRVKTFRGEEIEFLETIAICDVCTNEVFAAEHFDGNLKALYDAYRIKNDYLSLENICEIPVKYSIGKRPLSTLLGWGELTFTRYCDGDIPTKQYADTLKRIYDDPAYFMSVLDNGKDKLKSAAYHRSKVAVQKLLGVDVKCVSKLNCVVDYILSECVDITNLALQKTLYYVQGFYYAFYNTYIFEEDCEAWIHGPVYKTAYDRYSDNAHETMDSEIESNVALFSTDEKTLIDCVIKYFCCYSGKILEEFTHLESPWLHTRGNLPIHVGSNVAISKELIGRYFISVKDKYSMINPSDIKAYSSAMFDKV